MATSVLSEPWLCSERELRKLPLEISIPRRVECVDAMRGIKSPAAAIRAARAALRTLIGKMEEAGWNEEEISRSRNILALLEGSE